jgi:hypothetical protein
MTKIELQSSLLDILTYKKVETGDGKFVILKGLKEAYGKDMYYIMDNIPQDVLDIVRGKADYDNLTKKEKADAVHKNIKDFNDMLSWLYTHKKSKTRNAIIKHIKDRILDINGSGGYLTVNMHKTEYIAFLEFKKQQNK